MLARWHSLMALTALSLVGFSGCRWWCAPAAPPPNEVAAAYAPSPAFGYTPTHPLTPTQVAPVAPAVVRPAPQTPLVPPPAPPDSRWNQPPDNAARGVAPEQRPDARLLPPEPSRGSAQEPVKPAVGEERRPATAIERPMPSLPVGIPQFAGVKDRVSTGLKPLLDGLDWLQSAGYRTVVHIRTPGSDDNADRREVEKRGMKYVGIELSPQSLSSSIVEQFNRMVSDTAGHPLFVYDKDGTLAGGLWYLYFRINDKLSDDAARTQASRLGLKETATAEHQAMWLAIQKYISSLPRTGE